jgi:hypothetical protein
MMDAIRGNFVFNSKSTPTNEPQAFSASDLISPIDKSRILNKSLQVVDPNEGRHIPPSALMSIVQSSLSHAGKERIENRKILDLMPDVAKATRLMISSIFSPNDLVRNEISVIFDAEDITEEQQTGLKKFATRFFQKNLDLKTEAPKWVYQFGYEAGSMIFAIIPLNSFEKIQDDSYVSTESFIEAVIEPTCHTSLFGFGDKAGNQADKLAEIAGLESLTDNILLMQDDKESPALRGSVPKGLSAKVIESFLATEALNLTDNPSVLQAGRRASKRRSERTSDVLGKHFKPPSHEPVVTISPSDKGRDKKNDNPVGNPILLRLPPESVTVIHTPGNPNDHQGYLVLLDQMGSPIDSIKQEEDISRGFADRANQNNSVISQSYSAYGINNSYRGATNTEAMSRIYTQIVSSHIQNRLTKAGFGHSEMRDLDAAFRCMFSRFLQQKQTRLLFLPKELVTYMTFEKDQNGYGVSRLNKIKFNLGMKMALQVSKVLAGIKAAMDHRKIEVKFTDNLMENPETIIRSILQQYTNKSIIDFNIDPHAVQSQIVDKAISIKGVDMPGLESFDLTNEPDSRSGQLDVDTGLMEYVDKQIINGLGVPASAMNSLSEDEYARSVTTTNLFFAMDVAIDQDVVIEAISDLLRKYATYSEEFCNELGKIVPHLGKKANTGKSSTDEQDGDDNEDDDFPKHYNMRSLIDVLRISLPKPNIAPSKTQFEALEAAISSLKAVFENILPDEYAGSDDTLKPVVQLLRAKFIATNIRLFLASSGISGVVIPDTNFSSEMKDLTELNDALANISQMLKKKSEINAPKDVDAAAPIAGY